MKKLKYLLLMSMMLLMFTGCGESDVSSETIEVKDYSQEPEGKQIKVENSNFTFTMDADTTHFSVLNKANGQTWYSNPQTIENDTIAKGSNKDILSSTLFVEYSDAKGQQFSYDNYKYAIEYKHYSIEEIENGVKVVYSVGDVKKTYIVPQALTEERMNQFCEKMSESDAKKIKNFYRKIDINNLRKTDNKSELLEQYPDLEDKLVYVMRDGQSDSKLKSFEEIFNSAGYTHEDYENDMSRVNVSLETGKAVFNIAVYYTLDENGLVVDIPTDEVQYYEKFPITYITPLPFFGAAGTEEEGYLFVPDGPGGKINFNNGKISQASYYNQVYGADLCITRDAVVDESEVSYPLIGIAKQEGSFLCAIEEGSSYAIVVGDVAGRVNSFNSVKFSYTMLHGEDMDISGKSDVTVRTYEKALPENEHLKQRYIFIDSNDYVEMAGVYRDYLIKKYPSLADKADENSSVILDIVGAVDSKDHVLGVPVTKDLPLTEFDAADEITSDLVENGVDNLTVKYSGWCNNGMHNSTTKSVKPVKKLGGKGDLKDFINSAAEKNVDIYLDANYQFVYRNKLFDKYSVNGDSCKFVSREIAKLSFYSPIYFAQLPEEYEYYLARPEVVMDSVDSVWNYSKDIGAGNVSFADIASYLNGDYNYKKHVSRESMMNMITAKYEEISKAGSKVMTSSDYFYNIPYSNVVTNMVLSNKSFNIVDETIPFYQIALHGLVNYTAESLNLSQDAEETMLKSAELGASLYYTVTDSSSQTLQDSKYTEYFATEYDLWKDTIIEESARFKKDFDGTYDEFITGHKKLADNVYETVYSDGTTVIVNYNYNDYSYLGETVPARDYIVKGGNN